MHSPLDSESSFGETTGSLTSRTKLFQWLKELNHLRFCPLRRLRPDGKTKVSHQTQCHSKMLPSSHHARDGHCWLIPNFKVLTGLEGHKETTCRQLISTKNIGWENWLRTFLKVELSCWKVFNKKLKPHLTHFCQELLSRKVSAILCNLVAKLSITIQSSSCSWWLNYQILILDQKSQPNVQSSTSSSLNQVSKNNCWLWSSMSKRMNSKLRNKNWSRNKTSSRSSWTNSNLHCWKNYQKPIQPLFWTTKNLLTISKRPKLLLMKFKNNQKLLKLQKLTSTLKEKSIDQWLLKAPCSISCVFLSVSLTTCISTHWKVSSNSSSKPSKEPSRRTKLELASSFSTSDTRFTSGCQEDSLKSINSSSCQWSLSDSWTKKSLMLLTHQSKWTSLSRVFPNQVSKTPLIGSLIPLGTWFRHFRNFNSSRFSLKIWKKTLQPDLKIGITNFNPKMLSCH